MRLALLVKEVSHGYPQSGSYRPSVGSANGAVHHDPHLARLNVKAGLMVVVAGAERQIVLIARSPFNAC